MCGAVRGLDWTGLGTTGYVNQLALTSFSHTPTVLTPAMTQIIALGISNTRKGWILVSRQEWTHEPSFRIRRFTALGTLGASPIEGQ